jgi:hypothetical protein
VKDLEDPEVAGIHSANTDAIDHNQYVKGNHVYQANYRAGLRILGLSGVAEASLNEVAYFDIYPSNDAANFNGAWSTYPFFNSGTIIVSGIEQGLFVLKATGINPSPPTNPPPTNPPPTPTPPPVAPPTNPPPTNPPPTNPPPTTGCGNGEAEFRIEITTDNYPGETSWDLRKECGGSTVIKQGGPYTTTGLQTESYCLATNQKYKFTIEDGYGDGICCSYGSGEYKVTFNGMTASGSQFGSSESKELGSCV